MSPLIALLFLASWLTVCGGVTGAIASSRGHNFWAFFFVGCLVSPVVGIVIACVLPAPQRTTSRRGGRRPIKRGTRTSRSTATGRTASPRDRNNPYSPPATGRTYRR